MEKTSIQPEPIDFHGLSYSPALLLDGRLSASITDNPAFADGCADGFDGYLDTVADFGERLRPRSEVRQFVGECVFDKDQPSRFDSRSRFSWRVGYVLGWLSGLAWMQYQEAKEGLHVLMELVEALERHMGGE